MTHTRRPDARRIVGDAGEDAVADWYIAPVSGYAVVARNWRAARAGEIDVIARRGATLVFCEVKTRRSDAFGTPAEAVTPRKQARTRPGPGVARRALGSGRRGAVRRGGGASQRPGLGRRRHRGRVLDRDARNQQPVCQWRRSSGRVARGTTTSWLSPLRISP